MLSVKNVSKKFKNQSVLKNISFEAYPGECIGLIGSNGSGKSTLLGILSGTEHPDSGQVFLDDTDILSGRGTAEKIGLVPQSNPLFPDMTALDHLKLWYSNTSSSIEADLRDGPLAMLNIEPFLYKKVRSLSGGMQKRLSIALALASRPSLLLLDEPDAALDLVCKEDIRSYIRSYCSKGNTVILATHDEADFALCTRLFVYQDKGLTELPGGTPVKEILTYLS